MSHTKYHTRGIVLGGTPYKEANKYLYILTEKFGLIGASVQGVRNTRSKLRYGLVDYSHSLISVVRGREVWRITNVGPEENLFFEIREEENRGVLIRILNFIKRFVGEEEDNDLYKIVLEIVEKIRNCSDNTKLKYIEVLSLMRILDHLGHLKGADDFKTILGQDFNDSLNFVESNYKDIVSAINDSIRESHL